MKIRFDIKNKAHLQRFKYVLGDFLMSNLAWFTYNCVRWHMGAVTGHEYLVSYLPDADDGGLCLQRLL